MSGKGSIRFSELFEDTVQCHGIEWACAEYRRAGMLEWELAFWLRATGFAS